MAFRQRFVIYLAAAAIAIAIPATLRAQADEGCGDCHGSPELITEAAGMLDVQITPERAAKLAVQADPGCVHTEFGCTACHAGAEEIPHPDTVLGGVPCLQCHEDVQAILNDSAHGDPDGGTAFMANCWDCHTAHRCRSVDDPDSPVGPRHVADRCLTCHDQRAYLAGVHGFGVQKAGLDFAATCVSCHGSHDILSHEAVGSRTARRNVSFTCGKCHGPVAETYRKSVHGAALTEHDNPDVPTCVDCHEAHATADPRSPRFRLTSPEMCGRCHEDEEMMSKYDISTQVFDTYVADFHGTTVELFQATTPDQPMNKAVCYDCHGFHDVTAVHGVASESIQANLLVRCQACHPNATTAFLSAWTGHYVPSPDRYAAIYYVRLFYNLVIPATIGFFLLYIAIDVWGRRRQGRSS